MEIILIRLLPALMWAGFLLRLFKHNIDKDYPFTFKTDEGRTNIKRSIYSGIIVFIFFMFALIIKADDVIDTSDLKGVIKLLGWVVNYLFWGWAIDSIFIWLMSKAEKETKAKIDS